MKFPHGVLVIDVESVGLHGDAFAVAYVQGDYRLNEVNSGCFHVDPGTVDGSPEGLKWVRSNVVLPADSVECRSPRMMRDLFWAVWTLAKAKGAPLAAECLWPVEANFLTECVGDHFIDREWEGPYPFHDIASIRLAAGLDPLATESRLPDELPAHNPLADARQSLRLLREALGAIK